MKKFMVLVMGLVSLGVMAGCDDDSKSVKVPAAVQAAFGEMFPAASHVEWEDKGGYMVADFRSAGTVMQAWFDAAGKWYMTEEDISYAELPRAVRTAYEAGDYAAWHVDDVDKLLRNGQETVYVLEVERAEQEFDLYYSEDGVLLREVPDRDGNDDHGDMLPQELSKAISDFIARKYPGARIVDAEREKGNTEVDIIFAEVRSEATATWNDLLGRIRVEGGTEREKGLFYSSLYRSFLWPALRSDVNGEFTDVDGKVINPGFRYYTGPSYWDDYRNKLILLGMLAPDVAADVISSDTDKGEKRGGFMPTFFHGDHASAFVAGTYLRGNRGFDVNRAYNLVLRNATVQGPSRPWLDEYIAKGYISEMDVENPVTWTVCKAAVTKTLEYSYDDYAVALLADALGDKENHDMLMKRTSNYKNLFDPSTGLMRGRLENGEWITPFDDQYPYYEYMYREANAWQQAFFAPHDTEGLIGLFPSREAFGEQLDKLFSIPWKGYEVDNLSCFIGQYCHGNQPDHSFPYLYYFIGRQERSQELLDYILDRFYGMGPEGLALCGMDDAGEMSSWYVFNAIGLYTYSPADPEYIVTVPLFDKVQVALGDGNRWTIRHDGQGRKITGITCGGKPVDGWFVSHDALNKGELVITTSEK